MTTRWRAQSLASRIASSVVLAPVALAALWFGGWPLTLVVVLAVLLAQNEFLTLTQRAGYPVVHVGGVLGAVAVVVLAAPVVTVPPGPVLLALGLWLTAAALRPPIESRLLGLALTVFGIVYVASTASHLLWIRELEGGRILLLLVVLGTWAADVGAFFVGVLWGRVRIAPAVSPGKSLEGLIGGFVASILVVFLGMRLLAPDLLHPAQSMVFGASIGIAAPLGDLMESLFKRNLHTKDASNLIPGHGGILDRIDSLLFTGPVAFYFLQAMLG